jgi:hypothetical protein
MHPFKVLTCMSIVAMLSAGNAAAGSAHPDPMKVRAALERMRGSNGASTSVAIAKPAATKGSALQIFSLRGTGTQNSSVGVGTCSGATCSASSGDCECLMFQGNLNATVVGNATWTAGITVNVDDCTNTGTPGPDASNPAFCCFGDGVLDATTIGKSPSILELSFTGPVCLDPGANDDTSSQGGFIIVTANSTGKFAQTAGTGQINFFVADDFTAYLSGNGVIQLTSPAP